MSLTLDLSYRQAKAFVRFKPRRVRILVVGVGGTGSHLVPFLPELARQLHQEGREVEIALIDPDSVEEKNVSRQLFFPNDVGAAKAALLAARYGIASGVPMTAIVDVFRPDRAWRWGTGDLTVLIGCTDNSAARRDLNSVLERTQDQHALIYVDAGNQFESGQVLIGTTSNLAHLTRAFATGVCTALPAPAVQEPALLDAAPEEQEAPPLSCAELALAGRQSRVINMRMAVEIAQYLQEVLVDGGLKRCATYLDLKTGTARSKYLTPATFAAMLGLTPDAFVLPH